MQNRRLSLLALLPALLLALAPASLLAEPVSSSTLESIIKSFVPDADDVGEEMCRAPAEIAAPV